MKLQEANNLMKSCPPSIHTGRDDEIHKFFPMKTFPRDRRGNCPADISRGTVINHRNSHCHATDSRINRWRGPVGDEAQEMVSRLNSKQDCNTV